MNHETINHSAKNGLLWKIGRFLWLLFWEYPICREKSLLSLNFNYFLYGITFITWFGAALWSYPDISADKFPTLEQATVVEGRIIRHPTLQGGGKHVSEPIAVETATGPIYKSCQKNGISCFERDRWKSLEGRPARLWFWNEWMIQLEVDGIVPSRASYEHMKRRRTSTENTIFFSKVMGIFMFFILARISMRYLSVAYKDVFSKEN